MATQFAFPFQLTSAGHIKTVRQDSPLGRRDMAAHLIMTRRREREMRPNFGVSDPTFIGIDAAEIRAAIFAYLVDEHVSLQSIEVVNIGDGTQQVTVNVL